MSETPSRLQLLNTMTGLKEVLTPVRPNHVGMYVCGVTAYDYCHLGHARSALVFDVLRRWCEARGFTVTYVRNYTDIDDKIIHRARLEGRPWQEVAETYIAASQEDLTLLGVRGGTTEPKATEYVPQMIELVRLLMAKGYAYETGGDVFFRLDRFSAYGRLSKRKPEELLAGARVEVDERKHNPLDFTLWKTSKPDEPGWESPWGRGRPGWHLECSTMATALLGGTVDLHGGGLDLIFPHHENEIAQSEAASGQPFVRCWVHNGFVTVDQEKMSKSLGNFFTIREIFGKSPYPEAITRETVRYLLLSAHYRSPLDFSDQAMRAAKAALDGFYILFQRLRHAKGGSADGSGSPQRLLRLAADAGARVEAALDDDFNTPEALAHLHQLRAEANRQVDAGAVVDPEALFAPFRRAGAVLGLFAIAPDTWRTGISPAAEATLDDEEIQMLVRERSAARLARQWDRADQIRAELVRHGVYVEDQPDASTTIRR